MKYLTKHFWFFCLSAVVLGVLFYSSLNWLLITENYAWIFVAAIVYGVSMFLSGRYFGIRNTNESGLNDWGVFFHIATFIIWGGVSFIWTALPDCIMCNYPLGIILSIWGVILAMHIYFFFKYRNFNSINGFEKEEIFE